MSNVVRLSNDNEKYIVKNKGTFSVIDSKTKKVVASSTSLDLLTENDDWYAPTLVAAGMSQSERSRKAKRQPRDSNGRFVAAGANVKYFSNGTEWSGTVDAIKDGKAHVSVRLPDGSISQRTLDPNTLRVYSSKARLGTKHSLNDENNDTGGFIERNRPRVVEGAEDGGISIQRADGYSIDAKKKGEGNPLLYQLYAPNGRSLGVFDERGESEFDGIISSDIGEAPIVIKASGIEVPDSVRQSALAYLEKNQEDLTEEQLSLVSSLANKDSVTLEVVNTVSNFFRELSDIVCMYGGQEAKDWSESVLNDTYHPHYSFNDEHNMSYFVVSNSEDMSDPQLIALDTITGEVLGWKNENFSFDLGTIETFNAPYIVPVDKQTAEDLSNEMEFSNLYPEERNLFTLAQDEIDFGHLDRIATLAYETPERSYDAKTQSRNAGGKFVETSSTVSGNIKYFAIVDSVDQDAVLDVVAIQNKGGVVEVFKRSGGLWVPDNERHAELTGPTPPTVTLLEDESQLKDVLSQIDVYDADIPEAEESLTASAIFRSEDITDYLERGGQFSQYVYNRAKALNRLDLIPEDWRLQGSLCVTPELYGEYGEVITASGFGLDTTNLQKLENYWLKGEGSKKMSWGTLSAIDDAYKVFAKYLGTERGYAFATILNNKYKGE